MGHMGTGTSSYINAAIDIAARNPNVYLETSGMPMHTKIKEAVERVGAERVLYGSDAPFHHRGRDPAGAGQRPDDGSWVLRQRSGRRCSYGMM